MHLNNVHAVIVLELVCVLVALGDPSENDAHHRKKSLDNLTCSVLASPCKKGILIPIWLPQYNLSSSEKIFRAVVYVLGMMSMFIGVAIISDKFVEGIEAITSIERDVVVKLEDGNTTVVSEKIWNATVANLTLMALGSSTPEILLSIIEIIGHDFEAGDLGPGTIVGSAAYNMFMITAICVYTVPIGESRKINQLIVFLVTAAWSIFAYIWMYIILIVISEAVVEIWEAVLTFIFFPALVLTAYVADRKILIHRCLPKSDSGSNLNDRKGSSETENRDLESAFKRGSSQKRIENTVSTIRLLQQNHPGIDLETARFLAQEVGIGQAQKTRSFYRLPIKRRSSSTVSDVQKKAERKAFSKYVLSDSSNTSKIFFEYPKYSVPEKVGMVTLTVMRLDGNLAMTCLVDYFTEDGATATGKAYLSKAGTLTFTENERRQDIDIDIVDGAIFNEGYYFHVHLQNARFSESSDVDSHDQVKLGLPSTATVCIIDDHHPGVFSFIKSEDIVQEDIREMYVTVCRDYGCKGRVRLPLRIMNGTARRGEQFEIDMKELYFEDGEFQKYIQVHIFNELRYTKNESFKLILGMPEVVHKRHSKDFNERDSKGSKTEKKIAFSELSGVSLMSLRKKLEDNDEPQLWNITTFTIIVTESEEFKNRLDEHIRRNPPGKKKKTFREQFCDVITVSPRIDDDDDEIVQPDCLDYIMHFTCLNWKILGLFVPSTDYCCGWACFGTAIVYIGVQTTLIGDMAASFGCTIGLKDSVTAITLVALGTSLPDTFSSMIAAAHEPYADDAIGNVTGSNAVNVFLGLGIAWTIAAVVLAIRGEKFIVPPGDLGLSVAVYCGLSLVAVSLMVGRRHKSIGGELGGPYCLRVFTSLTLVSCWVTYLVISTLAIYCIT